MIYKVGDKVRVKKDLEELKKYGGTVFVSCMDELRGKLVTIAECLDWFNAYKIKEDGGNYNWTDEMFVGVVIEVPSITKRINDKHNILNGLLNSDGSVDGEKLMEKLEENQVQVANGVVMNDKPQRPTESASTPDDKAKDSYYEKAAMQPLEVSQVLLTREQFAGALLFNIIKYRMRSKFKGQYDSDLYKARQYAYWLELVRQGKVINPNVDVVPEGYEFKLI